MRLIGLMTGPAAGVTDQIIDDIYNVSDVFNREDS